MSGSRIAELEAENAALKREVERLTYDGIHSCGPTCERVACVLRREKAELVEALQACADAPYSGWTIAQGIARTTLSRFNGEKG